jgi:glycosyltransferase involved in cell wall biosynthesis
MMASIEPRTLARDTGAPGGRASAPIHLLFILTSAGIGGAEMLTIDLLNRLDPKRFRLSLAYLKAEHDLVDKIDRAKVHAFCCHVERRLDWRAAWRLGRYIARERVSLIVCTNLYPLLYGWVARCLSGCAPPVIEVLHSIQMPSTKANLQMLLYRPLLRLSHLVYVCENQRRLWQARRLAARADLVIHNGIDTDHFRIRHAPAQIAALRRAHGLNADDYVVGLCAYMRPEKAHGDLLEAVARARARGVALRCLLIGDGPERSAIERRITALGLDGEVAITGLLPDVRLALAACDALVIASRHETFSIAALESMAMGKPLIMTNVGGASEQVSEGLTGYLYTSGDVDALTDRLQRLADPGRRARMGELASQRVREQFSTQAMVHAYQQLFARLAPAQSARGQTRG